MIGDPMQTGRPLLLLHGFAGQPDAWDEVVAGLDLPGMGVAPRRVRLPGHGPDPEMVDGGFDDVVNRLAAELEGSEPCDVAGYSLGARVALGLVLHHPSRVRRALLVGVNPGLQGADARAARRAWDERWAARIEREGLSVFADAWAELPLFATQRGLDDGKRAKQQRDRCGHTTEGLAWAMRCLGLGNMPSRWEALGGLERPVTWLAGELDDKYVTLAERVTEATEQADVLVVPGAGHNLLLEAPAACRQALAAMIAAP